MTSAWGAVMIAWCVWTWCIWLVSSVEDRSRSLRSAALESVCIRRSIIIKCSANTVPQ